MVRPEMGEASDTGHAYYASAAIHAIARDAIWHHGSILALQFIATQTDLSVVYRKYSVLELDTPNLSHGKGVRRRGHRAELRG